MFVTGKYLDSVQTLRKYQEIINTIRHIDATDIKSLSTNVSSSWPTVKSAIEELANNNLIRVPNGNDVKKFIINPDFACFLGIAIGATETKISIIDFEFKPIDILNDMYFTTLVDEIKKIYPVKNDNYCLCFDSKLDYFEIYKFCTTVIDLALDFFQQNSICNKLHLLSVGISLPGIIDKNTQEMTFCPNIPSLVGMPVKKILSNETREKLDNNHIPFYIYRDSMAATVGEKEMLYLSDEKKKQYKNKENIAVFYLGYGLSSGYIFNNQLILGASGATGEIGHICIDIDSQKVLDKCNDDLFIVNGSLEDNIKLDSIDNDCDCSRKLCLESLVRLMVFNSFSPND